MFQVFLIIFWATIRLQNRGDAVCDPSVGNPSGSQANHLPLTGEVGQAQSAWLGGVAFLSTTPVRDPSVSNPSGSQANHLPLTGEATSQSMRLFTAASIYSHTPRKFLFTSLFGMRRTVKP